MSEERANDLLDAMRLYGNKYGPLITSSLQIGDEESVATLISANLCKLCAVRLYDILTAFVKVHTLMKPREKKVFKKDGKSKKDNIIASCLKEVKKRIIDDELGLNCPYPAFAFILLYAISNEKKYWKSFIPNVNNIQKIYDRINIDDMKRCLNPESELSWEIIANKRKNIPIKRCTPLNCPYPPILLKNLDNIDDGSMVRKLINVLRALMIIL